MINKEVTRHIRTHTKHSSEDQAAVHFLENHLKSDGKINLDFAAVDKWPNIDGRFEFVQEDQNRTFLSRLKAHINKKNVMVK